MVFPLVIYGCESWTVKKAEHQRIDAFELWCWRRLLRVPWTPRRSNQSILKEIGSEYWLEGLMLKLKLQYFGHLMRRSDSFDAAKDWRKEEKGMTEDEMVEWHHWLNGHELEQAPGVGDGQGGLACCSPWGRRFGHDWVTELNWKKQNGWKHWFLDGERGCFSQCERITVREVDLEPLFILIFGRVGSSFLWGLLIVVAPLAAECRLWGAWTSGVAASGSRAEAPWLWRSGSVAWGSFLDQGLNSCLLHSLALSHQGRSWCLIVRLREGRNSSKNKASSENSAHSVISVQTPGCERCSGNDTL